MTRRRAKGGFEFDAFTRWRRLLVYMSRAGVRRKAKRQANRRERREARQEAKYGYWWECVYCWDRFDETDEDTPPVCDMCRKARRS